MNCRRVQIRVKTFHKQNDKQLSNNNLEILFRGKSRGAHREPNQRKLDNKNQVHECLALSHFLVDQ